MGAAANDLTTHTGLSLPAVDIGWPGAAAISWAWPYAFLVFPLQLAINFVMLVTKQTKTLNVDLWNVWNKIFTAVIVTYFTNNIFLGFIAAAIIIVLELKLWRCICTRSRTFNWSSRDYSTSLHLYDCSNFTSN